MSWRGKKSARFVEGQLMPDHVHMVMRIPPKYAVSAVIGFLKGKSAIAVARLQGKERNFTGEQLWARGYAVSTVGFELDDGAALRARARRCRRRRSASEASPN